MKTSLLILVLFSSYFSNSFSVKEKNDEVSINKYSSHSSFDTLIIKVKKKDFETELIAACQGWQQIIKCGIINTDDAWMKMNNKKMFSWKTYMAPSCFLSDVKKDIDAMNLKFSTPFELIGYVMTKRELHVAYFTYLNKNECAQAWYRGTHIEYKVIVGENSNNYSPGCSFICKE